MDIPRDQQASPDTVTIPREEYEKLKKDQAWLRSLEGAGVDNWDGYSHAADSYAENYPEYKDVTDA